MSDIDDDKKWFEAVVQDERFQSVLGRINSDHIQGIEMLTDEQIRENAIPLLATLRGVLQHERALLSFATTPDFEFAKPVPETYPDEVEEANTANLPPTPQKSPKKPRIKRK